MAKQACYRYGLVYQRLSYCYDWELNRSWDLRLLWLLMLTLSLKKRPSKPTLKNSVSYLNHLSILSLLTSPLPNYRSLFPFPANHASGGRWPQFRSFYYSLCLQFSNLILTAHLLRIFSCHLDSSFLHSSFSTSSQPQISTHFFFSTPSDHI